MSEWKYFDMSDPRPDTVPVPGSKGRANLEHEVAQQVALLLSLYGQIEETEVDNSPNPEFEEPITLQVLRLDEELLDDDTELVVSQLPRSGGEWDLRPGVHSVEHVDDQDLPIRSITVHDPSHRIDPPIYYSNGQRVELDVVQELHDALDIMGRSYTFSILPNNPPLETSSFPAVVSSDEFETLVARLGTDFS